MYAIYGNKEVTVTFTIDASKFAEGAKIEILSPACIQGRGVCLTSIELVEEK